MSNHTYEIEIKSLLGNKENAHKLTQKMREKDANLQTIGSHKQLNHYFVPTTGSLKALLHKTQNVIDPKLKDRFKDIAEHAKDFSVRTRWADGKVLLVVKASVDDTTSFNGTARLELESLTDLQLEELDKLVLNSGFEYQAKWSRERSEYKYHPSANEEVSVAIDKNAGYGHLAEFEMLAGDKEKAEEMKARIREIMKELDAEELLQDRLARMFDFYNRNWRDYYGTDKIFVIE